MAVNHPLWTLKFKCGVHTYVVCILVHIYVLFLNCFLLLKSGQRLFALGAVSSPLLLLWFKEHI